MKRALIAGAATLGVLAALCSGAHAQAALDLETGYVFPGYNDVRIPGDTGTLFSLSEDLNTDREFFFRGRVSYVVGEKHTFSILVAPLSVHAAGIARERIRFALVEFSANSFLKADYRFDSYRFTYRYRVYRSSRLDLGLGVTGKIRDAEIRVESGDAIGLKKNVGFVPLINFHLAWVFAEPFSALLEGDALAAPQGRAEDVLLALCYRVDSQVSIKLGYRVLEGGADNDEVYTFSLFNYFAVGLLASF